MKEENIKVEVSRKEDCRRLLSIEIGPEMFQGERERVLGDFVKEASVPGFRKGKVPRDLVRRKFADEIEAETLKAVLPAAYSRAVSSEKLKPIGDPVFKDIVADTGKPVSFCVELEVAPELEISEYRGIEVEKEEVEITGEEVDKVIENLRERFADFETVERGCVNDDVAVIDYMPLDDNGEPEEDKKVEDYPVHIGSGQILPDFEKELAGCEPGKTGEVEISYPEDYKPAELAGTRIRYRFTVKEVKEKRLPPLDDELASKVDEKFKTLDDLRKDVRKRLEEEKSKEALNKAREKAIDKIIEENTFEIPLSMVERYVEAMVKEAEERKQRPVGDSEEEKQAREKQDEVFKRIARRNIKRYFIIDYIAGKEKVEAGDEEIDEKIKSLAEGSPRSFEEVRDFFKSRSESYENLRRGVIEDKVFDIILGGNLNKGADK